MGHISGYTERELKQKLNILLAIKKILFGFNFLIWVLINYFEITLIFVKHLISFFLMFINRFEFTIDYN